jgi:hypothetical protein
MIPRILLLLLVSAAASYAGPQPAAARWDTLLWRADNGQNEAWVWGVGAALPLGGRLGAEASVLQGRFNQGGDIEEVSESTALLTLREGRGWVGFGFGYFGHDTDLERGFVWSYPEEEIERNADVYGPLLAAGLRLDVLAPSIHLDLAARLLPHDFGDLDDVDANGRFAEAEAALVWSTGRLTARAGYRYRYQPDTPDRVINDDRFDRSAVQGFLVSLGVAL